jgi:sugar O-acyltransferase (sialic acid O-acetyltransferase NeuD family)
VIFPIKTEGLKNMTSNKVVIIGAGGFAREVVDIIDAINQQKPSYEVLGYLVDPQYGKSGTIINDLPILGGIEWLENYQSKVNVLIAVGASNSRFRIFQRIKRFGCHFVSIIHPNALITRWVTIGDGTIIGAGSILTNQIRIGNQVVINLDCTIGHDVVLEDFVTLSPGVHISGNVNLRQGSYIGTGANVIEKISVGDWAIIGAGSTVVREIPPNTTAVGVPAKVIKTMQEGWQNL